MFCPRCGATQSDELKFCKACGANLYAVRQVVDTRADQKFDWSKTWVADMFMSGEEAERRQAEMELRRGITPAIRRYQEIKAGVITLSAGFGLSVFLMFLMNGIIRSGRVSIAAAEILGQLWAVGILPVMVGLALIVNGYFVSRKIVELSNQTDRARRNALEDQTEMHQLHSPDTKEFLPTHLSVTEGTTKHLVAPPQD